MRLARGPAIAAGLVAAVAIAALAFHHERPHATQPAIGTEPSGSAVAQVPLPTQTPPETVPPESTDPPAPQPEAPAPLAASAAAAPAVAAPAVATAPRQQDLSGSWSGEYVDASGKQLLRVVNLSISNVRADGGIEGTLEYQAASGNGECKLHPRGSIWSASARRLQLSPEGCSPHYPRELGVPLDFAGVNPRGNTLKDGRIEAPTGDLIRVRLKRVI